MGWVTLSVTSVQENVSRGLIARVRPRASRSRPPSGDYLTGRRWLIARLSRGSRAVAEAKDFHFNASSMDVRIQILHKHHSKSGADF